MSGKNAKEKHKLKLIEYLADPDNPFLPRTKLSLLLGFSAENTIYAFFSPNELDDIEHEALEVRRKRYTRDLAAIDKGLLDRASTGDPVAAKLVYQRFEGFSEKQKREITLDGPVLQQIFAILPPELGTKLKASLLAMIQTKELT